MALSADVARPAAGGPCCSCLGSPLAQLLQEPHAGQIGISAQQLEDDRLVGIEPAGSPERGRCRAGPLGINPDKHPADRVPCESQLAGDLSDRCAGAQRLTISLRFCSVMIVQLSDEVLSQRGHAGGITRQLGECWRQHQVIAGRQAGTALTAQPGLDATQVFQGHR